MYRLKIDFPLGENEEEAIRITNKIIAEIIQLFPERIQKTDVKVMQYLLAEDTDRTVKNYLDKDENGHVSTKKFKIEF